MFILKDIVAILRCKSDLRNEDAEFSRIFFDTRKMGRGKDGLFLAIKSKNRDGFQYIEEAYAKGIRNFMITTGHLIPDWADANFIIVTNVIEAIQKWAAHHRKKLTHPSFIGITGSNGKTIVKEWLSQLLSSQYRITKSPLSYNSQLGVPLSILMVREDTDYAIIEVGISQHGEMDLLGNILEPDIGIITNIGDAHAAGFRSQDEKLIEKLKLFKNSRIIIYEDQGNELSQAIQFLYPEKKTYTWSTELNADTNLRFQLRGNQIHCYSDHKEVVLPLGNNNVLLQNIYHAVTVAHLLTISDENLIRIIRHFDQLEMRMEHIQGIHNSMIINDAYVLDMASLRLSLEHLSNMDKYTRKCLILSAFPNDQEEHHFLQQLGQLLSLYPLDRLITVGRGMNQLSFSGKHLHYEDTMKLLEEVTHQDWTNYAILLKGSRLYGLDRLVSKLERASHSAQLEINLSALHHNISHFRDLCLHANIIPVLKASAYGGGIERIARTVAEQDPPYIAVAYIDEGLVLRNYGIDKRIIVLNPDPVKLEMGLQHQLEMEIYSLDILHALIKVMPSGKSVQIHIKFDTGMHRLGFRENEIGPLGEVLKKNPALIVATVFSHLSGSEDSALDAYSQQQIDKFDQMVTMLSFVTGQTYQKHILNSEGISRFPDAQYDYVRLGLGLYGISSTQGSLLQTVYRLTSRIISIKSYQSGESIGYNRAQILDKPSLIGVLNIGYADGLMRSLSQGKGQVWYKDHQCPIVGNICMDLTMIDITSVQNPDIGDSVEIFGPHQSLEEVANAAGTIPYEILTGLSDRIVRKYTLVG